MASIVQGDLQPGTYLKEDSDYATIHSKAKDRKDDSQIKAEFKPEIAHPEHKPRRCLVGTSVFVFRQDAQGHWCILLGPRKGSHGKGTLAPPGGHIETGEYFEKTCRREVAEETGLEIKDVRRMTYTDDIFFIRDEENGEELQSIKDINDIKHYETNFLGAVLLDEKKFEPVLMEPGKCAGWLWIRVDHVKRIFDESPEGALRCARDNTGPRQYGEDKDFEKLVKDIETLTAGKPPKLFLPLSNLWLQKGNDYNLHKEYEAATPESVIIRQDTELALINKWKAVKFDNGDEGLVMMKRALEAQKREIEALTEKLNKAIANINAGKGL